MDKVNFLDLLIARLLDSVKIKNPKLFYAISLVVFFVNMIINEVMFQNIFKDETDALPTWLKTTIAIVSAIYLTLVNMGTYQIKQASAKKF